MADMVGGGVGGMTGALQGTVTNVVSKGQNYLDRFFPPEKRQDLYAKISKFATEKPMIAVCSLSNYLPNSEHHTDKATSSLSSSPKSP